jgi:hypothetical protein
MVAVYSQGREASLSKSSGDAVAERAMSLLVCWSVIVTRFDGEYVHFGAARGALPFVGQPLKLACTLC